jgi:hypothetical protein
VIGKAPRGGRVITVAPSGGRTPLALYLGDRLDPVPRAGVPAADVAVLVMNSEGRKASAVRPLPGPLPEYREVRRVTREGFTVVFLRAPTALAVLPHQWEITALDPNLPSAVLFQAASHR